MAGGVGRDRAAAVCVRRSDLGCVGRHHAVWRDCFAHGPGRPSTTIVITVTYRNNKGARPDRVTAKIGRVERAMTGPATGDWRKGVDLPLVRQAPRPAPIP